MLFEEREGDSMSYNL